MIHVYRAKGDNLRALNIRAHTMDEATQKTGHGVYASFRTYEGQHVFRVGRQLDRMRSSAGLLGRPFPLSNDDLREMTRRVLQATHVDPARVRITVTSDDPESAVIAVQSFTPIPSQLYEHGVEVGLTPHQRETARAKDSRWIDNRSLLWAGQPENAYEVMLHDEAGHILEGLSSNFYAVLNGELRTADEGVLAGVARSVLLEVAPQVLPVTLTPIALDDLPHITAAMLTSSSRGVIPIVYVGEVQIGDGSVPEIAHKLRNAYDAQIEAELEPL